jgi:hypothetical protein
LAARLIFSRNRLHGDGKSLIGVEGVIWGNVEAHELEIEVIGPLKQWHHKRASTNHDIGSTAAVDDERSIGTDLSIERAQNGEHEDDRNHDHCNEHVGGW